MSDETKIKGMGSIAHAGGVAFRVWAPHAERVAVIGSFNGWEEPRSAVELLTNTNILRKKQQSLHLIPSPAFYDHMRQK